MPTYEYACRSCGTHIEVYQRFSDPPLSECGVCGGALRKVFHPAGILFKGSGFYATDSRRGGSPDGGGTAQAKGEDAPKPAGAGKPEGRKEGPDQAKGADTRRKGPAKEPRASSTKESA